MSLCAPRTSVKDDVQWRRLKSQPHISPPLLFEAYGKICGMARECSARTMVLLLSQCLLSGSLGYSSQGIIAAGEV